MSVTVVIPLFNKARTIGRALDSVLAQSMPPDEIVVVDDGSTDDSAAVITARRRPAVRLIRQANAGVSAARNRGIEAATAARVAFLDADDEWEPGFLAAHAAAWSAAPDLVASFTNYRRGAGAPELQPDAGPAILLRDYCGFCLSNAGKGMCSSVVMASRRFLRYLGGFPVGRSHGEDLDTWARLAWSGRIAFVPPCLATYHDDSGASGGGVPDLDITPAYRRWLERDAIPAPLRHTSAALVALNRFRSIHYLARAGRRDEGHRRYRELPLGTRLTPYGLAAWLSLTAFPVGQLAFRAVERANRQLARQRWRHTWQ